MHKIMYLLVFVGAFNWGLIGLFGFNLVAVLFGSMPVVENLVYILVGVSALVEFRGHMSCCRECCVDMGEVKKKKKR